MRRRKLKPGPCCQKWTIKSNMTYVGVSRCVCMFRCVCVGGSLIMISAMVGRAPISKGQGNARGRRVGRLPVGKHPHRLK